MVDLEQQSVRNRAASLHDLELVSVRGEPRAGRDPHQARDALRRVDLKVTQVGLDDLPAVCREHRADRAAACDLRVLGRDRGIDVRGIEDDGERAAGPRAPPALTRRRLARRHRQDLDRLRRQIDIGRRRYL